MLKTAKAGHSISGASSNASGLNMVGLSGREYMQAQKKSGRFRILMGAFRFPHNLLLSQVLVSSLCYFFFFFAVFFFAVFFFAAFLFFAIICHLHMAHKNSFNVRITIIANFQQSPARFSKKQLTLL